MLVKKLIKLYQEKFNVFKKQSVIKKVFTSQGKKDFFTSLKKGVLLNRLINTNDYYLTEIDLFILSKHYNLPLVLICNTSIPSINTKTVSFINKINEINGIFIIYGSNYSDRKNGNFELPPKYGILSKKNSYLLFKRDIGYELYKELVSNNITYSN